MSDFGSIVDHPNAKEIISKLISGTSPKDVSNWLKLKYSDKSQSHLRLSVKILKDFVDSGYINCYNQFSKDLAVCKSNDKIDKKISESLAHNASYKERLMEIANYEIDIRTSLNSLIKICQDRAEQVFDKMQENPGVFKGDHVFIKYMEQILNMLEKYDKMINNAPDKVIQHNVTIQTVNQYVSMFQDTIREVLLEMDPQLSMIFMEKLSNKLSNLELPEEIVISPEQKMAEVSAISNAIMSEKLFDEE